MGKHNSATDNKRDKTWRTKDIISRFIAGETLAEIGEVHGVTRERVRQILKKSGYRREDGGRAKAARERAEGIARKRRDRCIAKWGVPPEEYRKLRSYDEDWIKTPMGKYVVHRSNAKKRGIEWNLTFKEWWDIWQESGKYDQRGSDGGQYVMSRILDEGAYEVGNVFIQTTDENLQEGHMNLGRKGGIRRRLMRGEGQKVTHFIEQEWSRLGLTNEKLFGR